MVQQVNRLAASLEQAKAQAALSAAEYKRAQGVEAAGALSAEDIEKRRATSVTDAANVKVVAAQLAEAEARLARTRLSAPVDGTVLTRSAEVGQIAAPGGPTLFRVASGGEVEMRGQIAEQDLARVKVGQPATVYLTGITQPFSGAVRLLGAVIDPATRLGDIRITLKPDPALRPGAFARAEVTVDKAQRPVLPQTAVLADSNGSYVLIVNEANKVERHAVHVSGVTDAGAVISDGLTGKERVVATAGGLPAQRRRGEGRPGAGRQVLEGIASHEKHFRLGHPPPGDPGRAVRRAALYGRGRLRAAAGDAQPGHLLPGSGSTGLAAGRLAAGDRDPDHAEGRGGGRRHRQHQQHYLARHRGPVAHLHRVCHRHPDRSRRGGRARCGRQGARQSAAGHRGACRAAPRHRPADRRSSR